MKFIQRFWHGEGPCVAVAVVPQHLDRAIAGASSRHARGHIGPRFLGIFALRHAQVGHLLPVEAGCKNVRYLGQCNPRELAHRR